MTNRKEIIEECAAWLTANGQSTAAGMLRLALKTAPDASASTVPEGGHDKFAAVIRDETERAENDPSAQRFLKAAAPAQKGGE